MRSTSSSVRYHTRLVLSRYSTSISDNNNCGPQNYNIPGDWDFGTWDNWAKTQSPNKNVKVYVGVAAGPGAAGTGYVPISTLTPIIQSTKNQYSSFGGVMMWDASSAYSEYYFLRCEQSSR